MLFAEGTVFQTDHKKKTVLVGVGRANGYSFDCTALFLVSPLFGSIWGLHPDFKSWVLTDWLSPHDDSEDCDFGGVGGGD